MALPSAYGAKQGEEIGFPQQPVALADMEIVLGTDTTWARLLKDNWPFADDFIDLGGGVKSLTYHKVLLRGKDNLRKVILKKKRTLKSIDTVVEDIWTVCLTAQAQQSSFFR